MPSQHAPRQDGFGLFSQGDREPRTVRNSGKVFFFFHYTYMYRTICNLKETWDPDKEKNKSSAYVPPVQKTRLSRNRWHRIFQCLRITMIMIKSEFFLTNVLNGGFSDNVRLGFVFWMNGCWIWPQCGYPIIGSNPDPGSIQLVATMIMALHWNFPFKCNIGCNRYNDYIWPASQPRQDRR